MANYYRGTIAKGLKQFDNGQHSDQFYNDMAWEGLANIPNANTTNPKDQILTNAWIALSQSERDRITSVILDDKNNGSKTCN